MPIIRITGEAEKWQMEKHKIPGKPCILDMFLKGGIAKSAEKICNDLAKILESLLGKNF